MVILNNRRPFYRVTRKINKDGTMNVALSRICYKFCKKDVSDYFTPRKPAVPSA